MDTLTECELEAIRQAFPCGEAEFEDLTVAGFGIDPVYHTPLDVGQTVSWPTALLVIGMAFLCIILTIGGL